MKGKTHARTHTNTYAHILKFTRTWHYLEVLLLLEGLSKTLGATLSDLAEIVDQFFPMIWKLAVRSKKVHRNHAAYIPNRLKHADAKVTGVRKHARDDGHDQKFYHVWMVRRLLNFLTWSYRHQRLR
jgi:hypothetical protein